MSSFYSIHSLNRIVRLQTLTQSRPRPDRPSIDNFNHHHNMIGCILQNTTTVKARALYMQEDSSKNHIQHQDGIGTFASSKQRNRASNLHLKARDSIQGLTTA